jgi:hypothetical protein
MEMGMKDRKGGDDLGMGEQRPEGGENRGRHCRWCVLELGSQSLSLAAVLGCHHLCGRWVLGWFEVTRRCGNCVFLTP